MEYSLNAVAALALLAVISIDDARGGRPFFWPGGAPRKPVTLVQIVLLTVFAACLAASTFVAARGT